jgi:hypothetical protein
MTSDNRDQFIRANTKLRHPPLVPEIKLFLADEVMRLWRETEAEAEAAKAGIGSLPPPYWAFAWPGGQALARYILDNPDTVRGRTVLDFGAGSGLLAIAAAKAGAECVVAAETDPLALAAIDLNSQANGVFVEPIGVDIIGTRSWPGTCATSGRWPSDWSLGCAGSPRKVRRFCWAIPGVLISRTTECASSRPSRCPRRSTSRTAKSNRRASISWPSKPNRLKSRWLARGWSHARV